MVIPVINKINSRLRFLYRQNRFLNFPLRRLLCNAMIQPFFDYACNAWYPNINKKLKMRLQAAQNKCIRFCLKLNDRSSIKTEDFEKINWLLIHKRVSQCSLCSIYKFSTKSCPNYFWWDICSFRNYWSSHTFIIPKIKCSSSKNKCWTKGLILCWSLALEQFKQDVKNFN